MLDGHQQRREKAVEILRRSFSPDQCRDILGADNVLQENDEHERVNLMRVELRIEKKAAPLREIAEQQCVIVAESLPR